MKGTTYFNGTKREQKDRNCYWRRKGNRKRDAITLAKRGVNVVVCSRTENDIDSVVYEIKRIVDQAEVLGVKCDVGRASQVISTSS